MARPNALITGASSGIGTDLAREAAKDGYDVVLSARRVEPMQTLALELEKYGASVTILAADLSKPEGPADLARKIGERSLAIDLLINNAGLGANCPFAESDITRINEMLQVNIVALTELTWLFLPEMVARKRGKVMLLASAASFQPGPQMAVCCASKAYVLSFGEAIAYELRNSGVTVTSVCPGATATEFSRVAGTENTRLHRSATGSVMSSSEVARLGYQGTMAGRRVVITGFMNRVMASAARISPHAMVLPIANSMMSTR
jgi:short-subunit dehydrogenase